MILKCDQCGCTFESKKSQAPCIWGKCNGTGTEFKRPPELECRICGGEGWVCEDHPGVAWNEGAGHGYKVQTMTGERVFKCSAAGKPCVCNTSNPPWHHGRGQVIADESSAYPPAGYMGDINGAGSDPDVP